MIRRATLILVLALGLSAAGCSKKSDAAPKGGKRGLRQISFPVEVMTVEAKPQEMVITAPGVIDAFERVQCTARVSGVVDRVNFTEGEEIKKGKVLAFIDSRRYSLNVSQARAALAKAEAVAADNEASLKRRENASSSNPGLIPGEELETYKTKLRTARADVDAQREALRLAQLNMEDSSVKALAEGVIQTRSVQTGQYVQAGTVLATLLRRDPMLLRFHVATSEAPRIKVGMPVEFTLKESQQTYTANITLIAAAAEEESRLVPVTAEVQADKKFWLRPGSFAMVRIKLTPGRTFPLIPQTAARPSDRGFLGYVVQDQSVKEKVLQLGLHTAEGWVEVRDGLQAGDVLVTRGLEALSDGARVQIVQPSAAGSGSAAGASSAAPDGSGRGGGKRGSGGPRGSASAPAPEAP